MIWVLIFGAIFLQERLSLVKLLGVFLIFLGIALASFKKEGVGRLKSLWLRLWGQDKSLREKGIILSLVASFLAGFEALVIKYLLKHFSPSVVIFGARGVSAVCFLLIIKNLKPQLENLVKRKRGLILAHTLAGSAATFLFLWATSLAEVSRTVPITQSFSVLTVVAGIVLLKEQERLWQKILGGILAAIGVVLVKGS